MHSEQEVWEFRRIVFLAYFFVSDKRKRGRNSSRNKDPGSLRTGLSQVMAILSQLSKNTGGTEIMGMKGTLLYCLYDLSSNNLY